MGIRHSYTATGSNNPNRQVSVDRWNEDHDFTGTAGMLLGADGTEIDPNTIGGSTGVATRAALASSTTTVGSRYLRESGREGTFVWSGSNLSTLVTADTQQGIYVAPSSDTTGASGAWVRKFTAAVNVKWFGATGNGVADDSGAFTAAIAYLAATAVNLSVNTFYKGSHKLVVPAGAYYMAATTLDIAHTLIIEGEGTSGATTSKLIWDDGTTGIRIQRYNTSGESTVDGVTHTGGDNTTIRGLYLLGGYSATEGEHHGIHTKARIIVEDCLIEQWSGDGIFVNTTAGSGGSNEGNTNNTQFARVIVQTCRNGFNLDGADENIWNFNGCQANANRQWGFKDSNFLGNSYFGCHTAANGAASANIPTGATHTGNRYMVVPGQEVWCSTNAPTGTAANNQGWLWILAGSASAGYPDWVTGTTYRAGGGYYSDDPNAQSVYVGCYSEGDQNPSYIAAPAMIFGGQYGIRPFGNALYFRTDTGGLLQLGPTAGVVRDYQLDLNCTNVYNKIIFRSWAGGVSTDDATLWAIHGGAYRVDSPNGVDLQYNATTVVSIANGTFGFASGQGGTITQTTSRTTSVTLNKSCGSITLVSAAGSSSWQSFTVLNSKVAATDSIRVIQRSGTDKYLIHVTNVATGSFEVTFATTGGTTTEQPVFNFSLIKAVAA